MKFKQQSACVGRFAPSPTGDLHFGSLVAAVASYLQAKSRGGEWLIRVEDIDPPREVQGSAKRILSDLEHFGLRSDRPVLFQSTRTGAYISARESLLRSEQAFFCSCSRKSLPAGGTYPGTCRNGPTDRAATLSVRVAVEDRNIQFDDGLQGSVHENLSSSCGDFVIWRADNFPAYQLAVVVDDAFQCVTEVVRGADLLDSTNRQIYLQQVLGLPCPAYIHLPVATIDGNKLGKRHGSDPVNSSNATAAVCHALKFLGHTPPPNLQLDSLWTWALDHWMLERVPAQREIPLESINDS